MGNGWRAASALNSKTLRAKSYNSARIIHISTAYLFSDCYSRLSQPVQPLCSTKIEILRLVNWLYPPDGLRANSRSLRADLIILLVNQPAPSSDYSPISFPILSPLSLLLLSVPSYARYHVFISISTPSKRNASTVWPIRQIATCVISVYSAKSRVPRGRM